MPENWNVADVAALRSDPTEFTDTATALSTKLDECDTVAEAIHSIGVAGWNGFEGETATAVGILVEAVGISMQALPNTGRAMATALTDAGTALEALKTQSDQLLLDGETKWAEFTDARTARDDAETNWRVASRNLDEFTGTDPTPLEDEVTRTRGIRSSTRTTFNTKERELDALQVDHGAIRDEEDTIHFDVAVAQFTMDFVGPMAAPGVGAVLGSDGSIMPLLDEVLAEPSLHDTYREIVRDAQATIDDFDGDHAGTPGATDEELLAEAEGALADAKTEADNGATPGQAPTEINLSTRDDRVVVTQLPDGRIQVTVNGGRPTTYSVEESQNLVIDTGDGNDRVTIDPSVTVPIVVRTGDGIDQVNGGGAGSLIDTGDGNDIIRGGSGNERVNSGAGNDTVHGGDGNDLIVTGSGEDNIEGQGGNDTIHAGNDNDSVVGGDGDDTIYGGGGRDVIEGNAGDDSIHGGEGLDYLEGGSGDDAISGGSDTDVIYGGEGNDQLDGNEGDDYVDGGSGDDDVRGGAGRDTVTGASGDDVIRGGEGDDTLLTGSGDDHVVADGFGDNDTIYAEDGDRVQSGPGDDVQRRNVELDFEVDSSGDLWIDADGDGTPELVITGTDDFKERAQSDVETLAQTPEGRELLDSILGADNTVTIAESPDDGNSASRNDNALENPDGTPGSGSDARVEYSPSGRFPNPDSILGGEPPVRVLAHELVHAADDVNGTLERGRSPEIGADGLPTGDTENNRELDAVGLPFDPVNASPGTTDPSGVPRIDPNERFDDTPGVEPHPGDPSENSIADDLGLDPRNEY